MTFMSPRKRSCCANGGCLAGNSKDILGCGFWTCFGTSEASFDSGGNPHSTRLWFDWLVRFDTRSTPSADWQHFYAALIQFLRHASSDQRHVFHHFPNIACYILEDVQIDNQPQNIKKYQMYFQRWVIILTLC